MFVVNFFIVIKIDADDNSNRRVTVALGTTVVLAVILTAAARRAF
jgi:hypothetical protein